jgi:hypothetical protein
MSGTINNILIKDTLCAVFSCLKPADFFNCFCVCKGWDVLSSSFFDRLDLRTLFSNLTIIDGQTWKDHVDLKALGLEVDDLPPIDMRTTILALHKLFNSPLIDKKAGITIITLPKKLTINTFTKFASPWNLLIKGNPPKFSYMAHSVSTTFGEIPVEKTCRIAVANAPLQGSRGQTYAKQEELIDQLPGCERAGALAVIALNMMSYVISKEQPPTRLFGDNPRTYTWCGEQKKENEYHVVVGDFAPRGLHVCEYSTVQKDVGVTPLRKL